MDSIERAEMVEKELDTLIKRRDTKRRKSEEDARIEDLWAPSVQAYNARRAEERRLERFVYHEAHANRLRNTLSALVAYHEAEAERYRNGHEERSA